MANRRIEVHEVRHVIVRMRMGDSDRQIQKAGVMGRRKIAQIRKLANESGWLNEKAPMPDNDVIAAKASRPVAAVQQSQVEPYAEQVLAWADRGVTATAIHAALVRQHVEDQRRLPLREYNRARLYFDMRVAPIAAADLHPLCTDLESDTFKLHRTYLNRL